MKKAITSLDGFPDDDVMKYSVWRSHSHYVRPETVSMDTCTVGSNHRETTATATEDFMIIIKIIETLNVKYDNIQFLHFQKVLFH